MHFHYGYLLPGYQTGPDNTRTAISYKDLSEQLAEDLRQDVDNIAHVLYSLAEIADSARKAGDTVNELDALRDYLAETRRAESISALAANLATGDHEYYQEHPEIWDQRAKRLIADNFPLSVASNTTLSVWECSNSECQIITYACKHCGAYVSRDEDNAWVDEGFSPRCRDGSHHEANTEGLT